MFYYQRCTIYTKFSLNLIHLFVLKLQSGKEIAEVIQKAVLAEKPLLRYQTSEFLTKALAVKYSDPTGEAITNFITQYSGW